MHNGNCGQDARPAAAVAGGGGGSRVSVCASVCVSEGTLKSETVRGLNEMENAIPNYISASTYAKLPLSLSPFPSHSAAVCTPFCRI